MNLIDNGIKIVEKIERVVTNDELYFRVVFTDWYGRSGREKKVMSIKDIENFSWME